jgi:hypothetical protein
MLILCEFCREKTIEVDEFNDATPPRKAMIAPGWTYSPLRVNNMDLDKAHEHPAQRSWSRLDVGELAHKPMDETKLGHARVEKEAALRSWAQARAR